MTKWAYFASVWRRMSRKATGREKGRHEMREKEREERVCVSMRDSVYEIK